MWLSVTRRLNHVASSVIFQLTDAANRCFDAIVGSMKGKQRTKRRISSLSVGLSLQNWMKHWDWSVLHLSKRLFPKKPSHRFFLRRDGSLSHRLPLHHNQPLSCSFSQENFLPSLCSSSAGYDTRRHEQGGKHLDAAIPKLWMKGTISLQSSF